MNEIKCPKCGEVFKVDESGMAEIVKQVRDSEFRRALEERENIWKADREKSIALAKVMSCYIVHILSIRKRHQFSEVPNMICKAQ